MLSYQDAVDIVKGEIAKMTPPDGDALVLYPDHTIERRFGWVFFWGSDLYKKTGEFQYALGGNAPFIVNRHTGAVAETGTAFPTEVYVQRYEASLG